MTLFVLSMFLTVQYSKLHISIIVPLHTVWFSMKRFGETDLRAMGMYHLVNKTRTQSFYADGQEQSS